jgi:hypothetical protein
VAEVELRMGIALLGRLPVQPRRLCLVLLHALAMPVAFAEFPLRMGIALLDRAYSRAVFSHSSSPLPTS